MHLTSTNKQKEIIKDIVQTICSKIGAFTVKGLKSSIPRMFAQCVEMMRVKQRA